jgi:hypothetical protein
MANFYIPKKSGLSQLQKSIFSLARKQGGTVLIRDVLIAYYGFKPIRNPFKLKPGAIVFNKTNIGIDRYNSASVAVCKAFNRLVRRGMGVRILNGIRISLDRLNC